MGRYIKLTGANFSKSGLPKVTNFSDAIMELPGLVSWFTASSSYVDLAADGTVAKWYDRQGGASFEPMFPAGTATYGPSLITSPQGFPGLHFRGPGDGEDVLPTPMRYSGEMNHSAYTRVLVATLERADVSANIMGAGIAGSSGSHILIYSTGASPVIRSRLGASAYADGQGVDSLLRPAIYADAFNAAGDTLTLLENGALSNVALNGSTPTAFHVVLSGGVANAVGDNNAQMTVFDVLFFDRDILSSSDSAARDALMRYARAKVGV